MKIRKSAVSILACMLAAILLSACGKQAPASSQAASAPAATAEAVSASSAAENAITAISACSSITGIVDSYDVSTISLTAADGAVYTFALGGAVLRGDNGAQPGDKATIYFTGTLNGQDTSATSVVLVVDTPAKSADSIGTINGTIVDAEMSTITVCGTDGFQYIFDKSGAQIYALNGLAEGNAVTVTYSVKDGTNVAITIVDNAANTVEFNPLPKGTTLAATTTTMLAACNINVRSGASTGYSRIGGILAGEKVYLTGTCSNGWAKINYHGRDGYVAGSNLIALPTATPTATPKPTATAAPAATAVPATPTPAPVPTPLPTLVPAPVVGGSVTAAAPAQPEIGTGAAVADPTTVPATAEPTEVPATAAPTDVPATAAPTEAPATAAPADMPAATASNGIGTGVSVDASAQPNSPAIGNGVSVVDEFTELKATVTDITSKKLTAEDKDGNVYEFDVTSAARSYANGIQAGNSVSIRYTGTLGDPVDGIVDTDKATVIAIQCLDANTAFSAMLG